MSDTDIRSYGDLICLSVSTQSSGWLWLGRYT